MAIVNRRMKVMHIISGDLWAGAEVQAYTLLKELKAECDLHVILMNQGELAERLAACDIPVTILDETQMSALKILWKMRKIMLSFKPDIVHTHRQKENILGALANLLSVRSKSVRTSHGAPEFPPKKMQRFQVHVDRVVAKYMQQATIAVSEDLSRKLGSVLPPGKIHVIHNGVDVSSLRDIGEVADFKHLKPNTLHVGIIGRLEAVKRVDIFLEMAKLVLEKNVFPDIQFHVIGDGKLRANLEQRCELLGLNEIMKFHGHRTDIAACLRSLDAIVMSSDHEGTPMIALEALALGTPVIAHCVGGLKEILKNYPEWLVEEQNPQSYAECLIASITSEKRDVKLDDHYTASECARRTIELYKSFL